MRSHQILKQYFDRKKEKIRSYSLRVLARDIKVSPSYLSEVFSGHKRISSSILKRLEKPLGLDEQTIVSIRKTLFVESLSDPSLMSEFANSTTESVQKFKPLSSKKYSLLHKWYYVAVLDLMTCSDFRSDIQWISRKLGLLTTETSEALQVLERLELIEIKNSVWQKKSKKVRLSEANSQIEIRNFHHQMITKALKQLEYKTKPEDFERRLIAGITLAVNPRKLKRAKKKLNDILHEISLDLIDGECSEVYQLNFQFFPLTTIQVPLSS